MTGADLGRSEQAKELQARASVAIVLNDLRFEVVYPNGIPAFARLTERVVECSAIDVAVRANEVTAFVLEHLAVQRIEAVSLIC